jgi:hypothetical protein
MESMTTTEIIAIIHEIEAVQGKHLPVRVESSSEGGRQAVVEVKYRPSNADRGPYIALITR